jgi:AraC-like DNA-binding protein
MRKIYCVCFLFLFHLMPLIAQEPPIREDSLHFVASINAVQQQQSVNLSPKLNHLTIFRGAFLFALFLVIVFSIGQYFYLNEKAFQWYALYLLAIFAFYFRIFLRDMYPLWVSEDMKNVFEAPLSYLSFAAYIYFFRYFTNIEKVFPRLDRRIWLASQLFLVAFVADIALQIVFGLPLSMLVLKIIRTVFISLFIILLVPLIKKDAAPQMRLLIVGSLFVILGSFVTAIEHIAKLPQTHHFWGVMRSYEVWGHRYYFLDMRTCLLLEIFCFSLALHIKIRDERMDNLETQSRLTRLSEEHETLIRANEQSEKDRIALEEKEAAMKRQIETLKNNVVEEAENTDEKAFILRGLKIIDANLSNTKFSVDDFAKAITMERGLFYPKWKKATGYTPNESIQNARLSMVQKLLLTTNLTIGEIAQQTGFNEASYLSQVFQKKFNQSPTNFRKK